MTGRDSAKYSRNTKVRRCGVVMGGALGAFVAAAAMATGSAAPAKADFEELLDPIIQPLLTSVTDALSSFDPAAATDLTSWTDSLLASLNSIDLAVPSAADPAAALPAAVVNAPTPDGIPLGLAEDTEPTVGATVDGASTTLLVDTGSSGLVIPYTDLDPSSSFGALEDLFSLGAPTSIGESGFSGGVNYIYATYDNIPVDYDLAGGNTLDTSAPIEVELFSWPTSFSTAQQFEELFDNSAYQDFLGDNDVTGILGIGDGASGGAGESPLEAAGYNDVTVDIPGKELFVGSSNPFSAIDTLPVSGATPTGDLTETVTTSGGQAVGTPTSVSDDLDSGGVYGTIPSSIDSSTLAPGDVVTVSDGTKELYSYVVGTDGDGTNEAPDVISGTSIDSGVEPFLIHPVNIDYGANTISIDQNEN
jgi:hypothetical protein